MRRALPLDSQSATAHQTTTQNMTGINVSGQRSICVVSAVAVTAVVAKTFTTSHGDDQIIATAHGYKTGLKVQVSNSGGALPGGLAAATDYYVIFYDGNTIGVSTTHAGALLGSAINITDNGSGTHTITPVTQSIYGKLQGSIDGVIYGDIPDQSQELTTSKNYLWDCKDFSFNYVRMSYQIGGGIMASASQVTEVKQD